MKVALLSYAFGEYCIRLANGLAQEAEVLAILPNQEVASFLANINPAMDLCAFARPRIRQPVRQIQVIRTLLQRIKSFAPDVIHIQQGHPWFNGALPFLRQYPVILTIHDPRHHLGDKDTQKWPQVIMDFGFRRAVQIIVHGQQQKQVVIKELGIPAEIIHVIPHVVTGEVVVGKDAAEVQGQDSALEVLFFGRIWEYKGLEYLIRAEPLITAQVPEVKIVIAGNGDDFARYRRMMVHPERFIVHNEYVSNDMRTELFRRASVVVLPYIEATQSGVIPVAYTFSKPVVATPVGSILEMIEDGRTGYLVPPRDEKSLADAVIRLLRDKDLRLQLGANGKRKIETECSEEVVAKKTMAVYSRALEGVAKPVFRPSTGLS